MRNKFDEQLEKLHIELIKMGALCEEAVTTAICALEKNDVTALHKVFETDGEIDQAERDIERLCMKLLLQQQPVATDLRVISSALKMITDMERVGDQASDIAEIAKIIIEGGPVSYTHLDVYKRQVCLSQSWQLPLNLKIIWLTGRMRYTKYRCCLLYTSFYAGIIACIFILAVKNAFIGFYNVPEETKILAGQIMTVFAFITICCSVNMTLIMGVLRGCLLYTSLRAESWIYLLPSSAVHGATSI